MSRDQLVNDFTEIIVEERALIDVRSPSEFAAGSITGAVNLPLLTDEQRHLVGIYYKEEGEEAAITLGHRLVTGTKKDQLIKAWCAYLETNPQAVVFCSRGGLRSKIAAQWVFDASGKPVNRLHGGYKALRAYLLGRLEPSAISSIPIIIGGRTGSGKTELLKTFANSVDLESIANHRGSSFGRFTTPQPGQADFENRLATALVKHESNTFAHLLLEDEGRHVGKRYLPKQLAQFFADADYVVLVTEFEERVVNIYQEYVVLSQAQYSNEPDSVGAMWLWFAEMNQSIERIGKRLGPKLLDEIKALLESGCYHQEKNGDQQAHKHWIRLLLRHYYDPMYDYQLEKKQRPPVLTGNQGIVRQYLKSIGL